MAMHKNSNKNKGRAAQRCRPVQRKNQHGAVAIEFAVLFIAFFAILYAIIAYSLPLLLTLTFKQLSADAGRAAIKADPAQAYSDYKKNISNAVTRTIEESWLPKHWISAGCPAPVNAITWEKLPGNPSYGYIAKDNNDRHLLYVCLERKYQKSGADNEKAIIPVIDIFGLKIPNLPDEVIRSHTTVRLN